jgi:4a-hydroxytetrahydrobiopterin dehydratase
MKSDEPLYHGSRLDDALAALGGWRHESGWLKRSYSTDGWRSTMLAVNAIAFLAEAANHHPDLEVHWGSVGVSLQTHSAGGVTDKDLQLAHQIEALVLWRPEGGFPGLEGQSGGWISG